MGNSLRSLASMYSRGGATHVLKTHLKLHEGKVIGAHWLWVAVERIAAGEDEAQVMADYGYTKRGD